MTEEAKARVAAHVALLNWLKTITGRREEHDSIIVEAMGELRRTAERDVK